MLKTEFYDMNFTMVKKMFDKINNGCQENVLV